MSAGIPRRRWLASVLGGSFHPSRQSSRSRALERHRRRRALVEQLHARELLAADGLSIEMLSDATAAEAPVAVETPTADVVAIAKSLVRFTQDGTQPVHDQWLLSWSGETPLEATYGPSVVESIVAAPLLDETYVVQFQQDFDVFAAVQHIGLTGTLESAYPLLDKDFELRSIPNDFLFDLQWHLLNDGTQPQTVAGEDANVTPAWDSYSGAGVVIGFIDEGIESTHEDLADNYRADLSFDYSTNSPLVTPSSYHGTGVAGLASAVQNNSVGVSGVAPESEIADIKLVGVNFSGISDLSVAQTLNHELANVDIYNKSLGPRSNRVLDPASQPGPLSVAALENAVGTGRGGLGSVIVVAAGNGGQFDDVNLDGYANSRHTIAVTAVDALGGSPEYTERGASILVAAPSSNGDTGLVTTDLANVFGLSTTDYTNEFGNLTTEGTSGSTAIVSGVVALMLEANPSLTSRDVQHILVQTARQNDDTNPDWTENAAGHAFSPMYGFGVVDAAAAVSLAETWSSRGPELSWNSGVVDLQQTLANSETATLNVKVPANFQLEHVQLELESLHAIPGQLEIFAISPSGTRTQLLRNYSGGADITFDHPLTSVEMWDEWAFGDWTIEIVNGFGDLELDSMRLSLFGNEIQNSVPELQVTDVAVNEDREFMNFLVSIAEPHTEPLTFTVYTMDDTAVSVGSDPDYVAQAGVEYTIPAGEVAVVVPVELIDNLTEEEDETFWLALSEPVESRIPFDAVVGTILNEDFPRVVDARPWEELGVAGSLVERSLDNELEIDAAPDTAFLRFDAAAGMSVSVIATTENPAASYSLELLDADENVVAGPFNSPGPGQPLQVDNVSIPSDGVYRWRTTGDALTVVGFEMFTNTVVERWTGDDGVGGVEVAMDASEFGAGPSRYAVLGTIQSQPITDDKLEGVAGDHFVDISGSGTALDLADDGIAQITTTVGNRMLPAGDVRISNNGVVVAGTTGIPNYVNDQLPTDNLGTILAPYWDDLTDASGNVYWEEVDVDGVDTLIVQWDDLRHFNAQANEGITFQVQIYQEGSGGLLARYVYDDISFGVPSLDDGASATVGYQIDETSESLQFSYNDNGNLTSGDVIEWSTTNDVDNFTVNLSGALDEDVDVILASIDGTPLGSARLSLIGPPSDSELALGTAAPDGIAVTNYVQGIPTYTITQAGQYSVQVEGLSLGDYMVLLTRSGAFDTEANDDQFGVLRKMSESTGAMGYLAEASEAVPDPVDFYELSMTNDDRVILETFVPYALDAIGNPDTLDPMIEIYDQKGVLIASDTDAVGDGRNARIRFIAPSDGIYRVGISAESGSGRYLLRSTEWVNSVPTGIELTNNELAENTSTADDSVLVGLLTTNDTDVLDEHVYELVSGFGDDDNGLFTIVGDQLLINQGVELDYETQDRYEIRVRSTDDYGDSVDARLNVFVLDRGEVELVTVGVGDQRSRVDSLTVQFDSVVAVNPGAFSVVKRGSNGGVVELEYTTDLDSQNRTVATITFVEGPFFQGGSLVDGNYELRINALRVRDATGNLIDGDRDGQAGGDFIFGDEEADGFYRFFGDVDGDRDVDFGDLANMLAAYDSTSADANFRWELDSNDDDAIDFADLAQMLARYELQLDFE